MQATTNYVAPGTFGEQVLILNRNLHPLVDTKLLEGKCMPHGGQVHASWDSYEKMSSHQLLMPIYYLSMVDGMEVLKDFNNNNNNTMIHNKIINQTESWRPLSQKEFNYSIFYF